MASTVQKLFFSDQFALRCGTVSVDLKRSKVLLIRSQRTGEHILPKDHKSLGETLEQTAKRETFAQIGIPVELLPVDINTPATVPSSTEVGDRPKAAIEPIAVSQRPVRGVLKIPFWYVATADSSVVGQEGAQQENKGFDTVWMDFDEVASVFIFR